MKEETFIRRAAQLQTYNKRDYTMLHTSTMLAVWE